MKAERLFTILNILLNKRKIPAPQLARHCNVSVRTIYRDIDTLSLAGIPVYTTTGRDGGIELVEGFTIERQLLETDEVQKILASLEGLQTAIHDKKSAAIIEKLRLLLFQSKQKGIHVHPNHVFIDFSPPFKEKSCIEIIEQSIRESTTLTITYYDSMNHHTERIIEPLALVYHWSAWYLYTYCHLRNDFRLFRLSRIRSVSPCTAPRKSPRVDLSTKPWNKEWEQDTFEEVVIHTASYNKLRLCELFSWAEITERDHDRIEIRVSMPVNEWSLSVLMSIPGWWTVITPEKLRIMVKNRAQEIFLQNPDTGCQG
ncbi:MAG: YafY family protein [Spirochaetes bacterium]|nr:YafY family protein [Spirochaetota bacterium]